MKKAILIGASGCGKTTLIQRIERQAMAYDKTQVVRHYLNFIDTPGEYLQQRRLYRALIISSVDADEIGLVQDCTRENTWIPPSFATTFAKPIFGVVTKLDLAKSPKQVEYARGAVAMGGAGAIFAVSAVTGQGIKALYDYLNLPIRSSLHRVRRARNRVTAQTVLSPEFGDIPLDELDGADQAVLDMTLDGGR